VLHSLAIAKVIRFAPGTRVLDAGTEGASGNPIGYLFPGSSVSPGGFYRKKIRVVNEIGAALKLENVKATHGRFEELQVRNDFVVSRAVATLKELVDHTRKLISPGARNVLGNGLICLKGGDLEDEIKEADSR
jgi:16S rRNA (guanine527-N7)-methyltransferase